MCSSDLEPSTIKKQKEKQEEENRKRIAEREAIENEKKEEIKAYCEKKKLYCKFIYGDLYVFKIRNTDRQEEVIRLLDKADDRQMELYVNYANNHPDNELQFIYAGYYKELDQMLIELKAVA